MKRILSIVSLLLAMIFVLSGCGIEIGKGDGKGMSLIISKTDAVEKTFEIDDFSIVLTDEYVKKVFEKEVLTVFLTNEFAKKNYVATFDSPSCAVFIVKEQFDEFRSIGKDPENLTIDEYCKLVVVPSETDAKRISEDGAEGYLYEKELNGVDYQYAAFVYKSSDAFWLVQFVTKKKEYILHRDSILKYAKSVSFSQSADE